MTGCIEPGVIPGSFMLTQVSTAGGDARAGTTGPGGPTSADQRYTVRSIQGLNLGDFIGQRVAVSGRFAADADETRIDPAGTTGQGAPPATVTDPKLERHGDAAAETVPPAQQFRLIEAESVQPVAGSCPAVERR